MNKTIDDVIEDLERDTYQDPEVYRNLEVLRQSKLLKGLTHHELMWSKTFGTLKYLVKEEPTGSVTICDLDSGTEFAMEIGPVKNRIKH